MAFNFIIFFIIIAILFVLLNTDQKKGLAFAIFLLIFLPVELFIELGGNLPVMSVYRVVVIVLLLWLLKNKQSIQIRQLPFMYIMIILLITNGISFLLSGNHEESFKPYLSLTIESVLFYVLIVNMMKRKDYINYILLVISIATIFVAIIGINERFTGFNPVDYLPAAKKQLSNNVQSTYNHPIMLGIGLSMGLPICLVLSDMTSKLRWKAIWNLSAIFLIIPCIYFTFSRGPWLALIVILLILTIFRYPKIKKRLSILFIIIVIGIILRPGVYDTIIGFKRQTFAPESLEGSSYQYRWELWRVAYKEISKSSERFAFGYGQESRHFLHLSGDLSYKDRHQEFESWDNQLASCLLETGILGLIIVLLLYLSILRFLVKLYKIVNKEDKRLVVVLIASISAYIFMTTNVYIFAPQLRSLFWVNVAIGVALFNHYNKINSKKRNLLIH